MIGRGGMGPVRRRRRGGGAWDGDPAPGGAPGREPLIALAGNPNAGKTSLFNALTGSVQQVSNYPGVTVECKEGVLRAGGRPYTVVDLPGTYSLTAYSQEEVVARDFLLNHPPGVIVNVVDATNLERNLYFTVQLLETRTPVVIALNMADLAEKRGIRVDHTALSKMLGVPVIPTVGSRGTGVEALAEACAGVIEGTHPVTPTLVRYGHVVDEEVDALAEKLAGLLPPGPHRTAPWFAVKLLERDGPVSAEVFRLAAARAAELEAAVAAAAARVERHFDDDAATIVAERRYGVAAGAARQCVHITPLSRRDTTEKIDAVVCNRVAGPVILVGVVAALFFWVFKLSDEWAWIPWAGGWASPTGVVEGCFEALSGLLDGLRPDYPMLHSLLDAALVKGVGGVLGFVPLIFFMFLFIAALEDSGYIARVAFILDRLLRAFGLQGKSIIALIVSGGLGAGGCAVPGVMATRTLREEKDRIITMLVAPFMNCGAKMPVYAVLIAAFFPDRRTPLMLLLWGLSWVVALCAAWVLRRTVLRGEQTPFVMELPPYHLPVPRGVLLHTAERTWLYIRKAGTVILAINILLWAVMYFPRPPANADGTAPAPSEAVAHSFAGRAGRALEPVTAAAGFDWRVNIALIGGFAAKEVVIGAMATVYAMEEEAPDMDASLSARLRGAPGWTPLRAFAMMLFVMLYAPCVTTIAVIRRETGTWKWPLFATVYATTIAFVLAAAVFQGGRLLGFG